MKTIYFKEGFKNYSLENNIACIGYFDGVHLGHQTLIKKTVQYAKEAGLKSMLITFDPSPKNYFSKQNSPLLTTIQEKSKIIKNLGIDYLLIIRFEKELMSLSPTEFIEKILKKNKVHKIVVGNDFRFGYKAKGTPDFLSNYLETVIVDDVRSDSQIISSTTIKERLDCGDIKRVNAMLGYQYNVSGFVIHGKKRGRNIGFPTVNLKYHQQKYIPATGVYAAKILIREKTYTATVNIGYNPTYENDGILHVEAYVHDFNEEIYGEKTTIFFVKKIREEKKFNGTKDLVKQMKKDVVHCEKIIGSEANGT